MVTFVVALSRRSRSEEITGQNSDTLQLGAFQECGLAAFATFGGVRSPLVFPNPNRHDHFFDKATQLLNVVQG